MDYVYQLIDEHLLTYGIFDSMTKAIEHAKEMHTTTGRFYQVNRIPLNTVGKYGETFDDVYHVGQLE